MRLLILGGNAFLGRSVAQVAVGAGDDVTCAARGTSGDVPGSARFVRIDRDGPDAYAAIDGTFDVVVDVSSRPSHVRAAVAALADRVAHWVYVSSASAYVDNVTPGQRAADAVTHEPAGPDVDDPAGNDHENYGPCKVACERAVRDGMGTDHAFICRAGLIVGPRDVSGRFTYWPVRLADGGEIAVAGEADDAVQWVDVRDLAAWLVHAGRTRVAGVYDGICAPVSRASFLAGVAAGVGLSEPEFTWLGHEFPAAHEVNPWAGPRSLPLWLPLPEYAGFLSRDVTDSYTAGLLCRDLTETARDTLAWHRDRPAETDTDEKPGRGAGLSAAEEAELLAVWHSTQR